MFFLRCNLQGCLPLSLCTTESLIVLLLLCVLLFGALIVQDKT